MIRKGGRKGVVAVMDQKKGGGGGNAMGRKGSACSCHSVSLSRGIGDMRCMH